jgi:CheY-like chemotaxis protein
MQNKWLYNIILLDIEMPILNGFEACEKIVQMYGENSREI